MDAGETDATAAGDRRRMEAARAAARLRVREIRRDHSGSMVEVIRQELDTTVRSASPFHLSLAASQGKSMDELVERIEPLQRWPRAPSLSSRADFRPARHTTRYFLASTASGWKKSVRLRGLGHLISFMQAGDDWAHLEAVNHSLEIEGRIGAKFERCLIR